MSLTAYSVIVRRTRLEAPIGWQGEGSNVALNEQILVGGRANSPQFLFIDGHMCSQSIKMTGV